MAELKASDIMTPHVIVASPSMKITEAAKIMNKYRIGGLPVVQDDKLVGILTERDIMRNIIEKNRKPSKVAVRNIMSVSLTTALPSTDVKLVAKKMKDADISRIPVVTEDGKLVGMITNKDVLDNAPAYKSIVLEQAKLKGAFDDSERSVAFGSCEKCGTVSDLFFDKGGFVCEDCTEDKPNRQKFNLFGRKKWF